MNPLVFLASAAVATIAVAAFAAEQNLTNPTTGSTLTPGAATAIGQHQQGQAYIQGTNGCEVSMWLDPAQIKSGGQQVQIHNCKQ